jgi:hypothetical protein
MQLFTAFTVCLDGASSSHIELRPNRPPSGAAAVGMVVAAAALNAGRSVNGSRAEGSEVWDTSDHLSAGRCSWKTHLVMEHCDMGTMQVMCGPSPVRDGHGCVMCLRYITQP